MCSCSRAVFFRCSNLVFTTPTQRRKLRHDFLHTPAALSAVILARHIFRDPVMAGNNGVAEDLLFSLPAAYRDMFGRNRNPRRIRDDIAFRRPRGRMPLSGPGRTVFALIDGDRAESVVHSKM